MDNAVKIHKVKDSEIVSVTPPTTWLTFGPWIYMVPQYKPTSVLILGYAGGTVAGLVRLLYGNNIPITGVDIVSCEPTYGVTFIQANAEEFVKTCQKFDAVVVDLFDETQYTNCSFITNEDFVTNLARIANYVAINTLKEPDLSHYDRLMKKQGQNKPTKLANIIHYYTTKDIPNLRPFQQ